MDLYTLLKNVSEIVTSTNNSFYEYALHTFDDNGGFLRTRHCWWDKCLENQELKYTEYRILLLTAEQPLIEANLVPLNHLDSINAKMQLHYDNPCVTFDTDDIIFDVKNGYYFVYLIDLINKTMQLKHFVEDLSQDSGIREDEKDWSKVKYVPNKCIYRDVDTDWCNKCQTECSTFIPLYLKDLKDGIPCNMEYYIETFKARGSVTVNG